MTFGGALDEARNPNTSPERLRQIAEREPALRPHVALNPAAYPGLLQWLADRHDPAIDAALGARPTWRLSGSAPKASPVANARADRARPEIVPGAPAAVPQATSSQPPSSKTRTALVGIGVVALLVALILLWLQNAQPNRGTTSDRSQSGQGTERWTADLSELLPAGHKAQAWTSSQSNLVLLSRQESSDTVAMTALALETGDTVWSKDPFAELISTLGPGKVECSTEAILDLWPCLWLVTTETGSTEVTPAFVNLADGSVLNGSDTSVISDPDSPWTAAVTTNRNWAFVLVGQESGSLTAFRADASAAWTQDIENLGAATISVGVQALTVSTSDTGYVFEPESGRQLYERSFHAPVETREQLVSASSGLIAKQYLSGVSRGTTLETFDLDGDVEWTAERSTWVECFPPGKRQVFSASFCNQYQYPEFLITRDGEPNAKGSTDGQVRILSTDTGEETGPAIGEQASVLACAADKLIVADGETARLFDGSGKVLVTWKGNLKANQTAQDDNAFYLLISGTLQAVDRERGHTLWQATTTGREIANAGPGLLVADSVDSPTTLAYWQ